MSSLQINDLFWTLQGEGHFSGRRALFVRLPFCNYDCPWCDTEYNSYNEWTVDDFTAFATQEPSRFAVITGGEPIAHKHLSRILDLLKAQGFFIACETNGSVPVPETIDFVTTSPKAYTKNKKEPYFVAPENFQRTSEWKYVVDSSFDFSILERHQNAPENTFLSLSPEYGDMQNNVNEIMEYIKKNPRWRLSLQTHKWINIP